MKSYLKFLSRNKLYTAIEAVGLAVSLAFVILIGTYLTQQQAIVRENPARKEIYTFGMPDYYGLTKGFTDVLRERLAEVETATSYIGETNRPVVWFEDGTRVQAGTAGTDADFFRLFPGYVLPGTHPETLESESGCLVSESFARLHSLSRGSLLRIDGIEGDITVGGIFRDFDRTLFKPRDILVSVRSPLFDSYSLFDQYGSTVTFAKVRQGTDREAFYDKAEALCKELYPRFYGQMFFDHLSLIRLDELFFNEAAGGDSRFTHGDARARRLLLLVVLLLLGSAVLNYINLSLALTSRRAKEMATRRLLGASRREIHGKYLLESLFFTTICTLIALLLAETFVPAFNRILNDPDIAVSLSVSPFLLGLLLLLDLAVGAAAGLIPAAIAGRYEPADVVKGAWRRNSKMRLSKVFIVLQNILAAFLIALALVMGAQYRGSLRRPLNCDITDCYALSVSSPQDKAVLLDRIQQLPCVVAAGYGDGPGINPGGQGATTRDGDEIMYRFFRMDTTVFRFLGIEVVKDFGTPVLDCVYFGERGFAAAGYDEQNHDIGDLSRRTRGADDIAGIIKDIPWDNSNQGDAGYIVVSILNPASFPLRYAPLLIKTRGNHKEAEDAILETVRAWDPGETLYISTHVWLEDNFKAGLQPTRNNLRLVELFTLLAVLIALLGLVAMSTYFSDIRTKDVAIRKVFGGTVDSELRHEVREYMVMVGIACAAGIPVAVWAARRYLEQFTWKLEGYAWAFVAAVVITLAISLLSVLWQVLRAARTNPAVELKKE